MKLFGKLIRGTKTIKQVQAERNDDKGTFHDMLEECLLEICKKLDIQVPVWLKKNTTELAMYHKTSFEKEQFVENVSFDRFEIMIEL